MIQVIHFLLTLVTTSVRSRLSLQAENATLRNQLFLYRKSGQRPRIRPTDRLLWCFIAKFWVGWRRALYFVQPRTVTTWQKKRFRDYWRALTAGIYNVVDDEAPASPWQNAYVERVIGTLRRELFDPVIVLNERHLKRLMSSYLDYYHPWRTHQSLNSDAPDGRRVRAVEPCNVVEFPAVHGLHHVYIPKAA